MSIHARLLSRSYGLGSSAVSEKTTIEKAMEKRKRATGLEGLGILRQAGPREHRSLHAAQAIFDNIAEIEQLAGEQGQLCQDDRVERYEWCRLVAMVIEVYMRRSE